MRIMQEENEQLDAKIIGSKNVFLKITTTLVVQKNNFLLGNSAKKLKFNSYVCVMYKLYSQ